MCIQNIKHVILSLTCIHHRHHKSHDFGVFLQLEKICKINIYVVFTPLWHYPNFEQTVQNFFLWILEQIYIPAQLASQAHCPNEHLIPASVT